MDLEERVAFAIAEADANPFSRMNAAQLMAGGYGDKARDIARAIIPIVMEEAAKMAEEHRAPAGSDYAIACDDVACAIRSRG